jgi:penicillin-binding protein 1C
MIRKLPFLLVFGLWLSALGRDAFDAWITATYVPPLTIETSVEVLDQDGLLLRAYTVDDGRWRLDVALDQVDPRYVDMLIAYEDKRFYHHAGVDPRAMLRAVAQAVWNGRIISGGSTLTMQVARLLEDGPTGTWRGKLRQFRLALALERRLTKAEILDLYMDRAPFGGNLEGVRAATRAYFGKEPFRLTAAEAALMVALPQSPEHRRPDRYYGNAVDARERVLWRMFGADVIDSDTVETALTEPVPRRRVDFPKLAPHLTDRLKGEDPSAGLHLTTLDADLQQKLETLANRAARAAGNRQSIALLVANHNTGAIVASVGSAGYRADDRDGFVDMTRAIRSPGSTLKPLIYGLAFDQGLAHPETVIDDRPKTFSGYAPQNFDGVFRGSLRVRDALKLSLNIPVVTLTEALGPARLMAHLRRAGVAAEVPGGTPGLAVALGGVGVSLEGLVQLYASLARGGMPASLSTGGGEQTLSKPVLSDVAAWYVGDILSDIAPPRGAAHTGLAYKTGTSYGHRDAWAIGYDGEHVAGVWMGRPDGTPVPGAFGGEVAAPILFEAFALLKSKPERLAPPPPSALLVSHGQLPLPLRHFRSDGDGMQRNTNAPRMDFPPDGAHVAALPEGLMAKVRDGRAPFTWLVDGAPILTQSHERNVMLRLETHGFVSLSVIDAEGRAARSRIRLD